MATIKLLKGIRENIAFSSQKKIFSASVIIMIISLGVKVVSTVKEMVVASHFGVSPQLDAFLVAYIIPSFLVSLFSGSLNSALIPTYVHVKHIDGDKEANKLFLGVETLTSILLLAIVLLLYLITPILFNLVFQTVKSGTLLLTQHLFLILLPFTFLAGIETLWKGVINANESFTVTVLVPLITPSVNILAIMLFPESVGIYAYAISFIMGFVVEIFIMGIVLIKHKIPIIPKRWIWNQWVKQVLYQYLPMLSGALLMSSTTLVDRAMASSLGAGSISILNYSTKIVSVIVGVASMAFGTVVLPYFSKLVSRQEWSEIRKSYRFWSFAFMAFSIPMTLLLIIFSKPIVELLFQRGNFSASDASKVSLTQIGLVLQMPFYLLGILTVRLIEALKGARVFIIGNAINAVVNVTFNWILMKYMGVVGIALSTSIVYLVSYIYLNIRLNGMMRRIKNA